MAFTYDIRDIAKYYRLYEDLMDFWHQKYPEKIYNLNYEKLTENQEDETRKPSITLNSAGKTMC